MNTNEQIQKLLEEATKHISVNEHTICCPEKVGKIVLQALTLLREKPVCQTCGGSGRKDKKIIYGDKVAHYDGEKISEPEDNTCSDCQPKTQVEQITELQDEIKALKTWQIKPTEAICLTDLSCQYKKTFRTDEPIPKTTKLTSKAKDRTEFVSKMRKMRLCFTNNVGEKPYYRCEDEQMKILVADDQLFCSIYLADFQGEYDEETAIAFCEVGEVLEKAADIIESMKTKQSPHKHDHEYFHDDCTLCQIEKRQYENKS